MEKLELENRDNRPTYKEASSEIPLFCTAVTLAKDLKETEGEHIFGK